MNNTTFKRLFSAFLCVTLALQFVLPSAAFATQRKVEVSNSGANHAEATQVSDIHIDGVDGPKAGIELDKDAVVTTAENRTWEIPVLWVRDDMQVDGDKADDGHSYLPVLAFFVPQEYSLGASSFTVTLSDSLTALFSTQDTITVYDASTGITYIMPASLRDLFVRAKSTAAPAEDEAVVAEAGTQNGPNTPSSPEVRPAPAEQEYLHASGGETLVEIHCAKTARDALSDEDLEWLIDLIRDRLEPQAVELLLSRFPAFGQAAKRGEIGKQIGMYVYYKKGDKDGDPNHDTLTNALAYVSADAFMKDGALKYCYLLAVDVESLLQKDSQGNLVRNQQTGKYVLVREGIPIVNLGNTIVHELFHALMHDFNRTGMAGGTNLSDIVTNPDGTFKSKELAARYLAIRYPKWFVEGTASAVENVYQFRFDLFQVLRRGQDETGAYGRGALNETFTAQTILNNYLFAKYNNGTNIWFDIEMSNASKDGNGNPVDTTASRYVTGYLATLYLCDLAAFNVYGSSAIQTKNNVTSVDASMLRGGLNALLTSLHEGRSLDELISILSPKNNGQPIYTSTDSFAAQFIKGTQDDQNIFHADNYSIGFVEQYLNYMLRLDNDFKNLHPNGSILFDFEDEYNAPISSTKKAESEYLNIIGSSTAVETTVKSDTANIGAGKSDPNKVAASAQQQTQQVQAAAKAAETSNATTAEEQSKAGEGAEATPSYASEEPEPTSAAEPVPEPAAATSVVEPTPEPVVAEPVAEPSPEPAPTAAPTADPAPAPAIESLAKESIPNA